VLDFDYASGSTDTRGADKIIQFVREHELVVDWLIETHVHADHLSASPYLQKIIGGRIGVGKSITTVQRTFGTIFNEQEDFKRDGSQFDHLFTDDEMYTIGETRCRAIHTPGHTPACMTHLIGDAAFVGDTLFMPDGGTARADFPGGGAGTLYDSIQKILSLPADTRLFICHDYRPNGRALAHETTVGEQKANNIHVNESLSREEFIAMREKRDATLGMPHLILPSLQVNMRAGHFPEPESDGRVYLKIPVNAFQQQP
jgi:glyoxylase-like metal-dependent hydrolase (beta-lactamase superfamily II)